MSTNNLIPFAPFHHFRVEEMQQRSGAFLEELRRRRTVRDYSDKLVPRNIIENCLSAAGTAPSGANLQPWHFVVVSDPEIKRKIRIAAETEEHEFYARRAPQEWLDVLAPLGTDENKPFLETAPYLMAIFVQPYTLLPDGRRLKHYYAVESVGIATGVLITALHQAGLATLTHTPSPMGFLKKILKRPDNERPFLLLVVGFPSEEAMVPRINKKSMDEIVTFL
ncbi:MAG TPA: nitroreductase family protein [Patescibacteria group bacterium]|nr:nitroreductase family protein [Patescibacteria group bacterium]